MCSIDQTPADKKLIHHANYAIHPVLDPAIDINHTDALLNLTEDDRRKFDQYQPYRKTITYYGGWIPGTSYESYPKNIGWVMPKRGVILLTVHFAPSAADESVVMGVNLFFKKTPVERRGHQPPMSGCATYSVSRWRHSRLASDLTRRRLWPTFGITQISAR